MLLNLFRNPAIAAPYWKGEYRAWLYAALAVLLLLVGNSTRANQVPTTSAGAGPITKTYPSNLNYQLSITGAQTSINNPSIALNGGSGVVTSAQLSPAIAANHYRVYEFEVYGSAP